MRPELRGPAGRVQGWDVIRGVGLAMVMFTHGIESAGFVGLNGMGIVGLIGFFALSGYLITGILIADIGRHGRVRLGTFYRNRAVRLLPPLVPVLTAVVVLELLLDRYPTPVWAPVLIGAFYVANLPVLREMTGALRHMWSLSFEEQFYLAWPLVLSLAVRRHRATLVTVALIAIATFGLFASAVLLRDTPSRVYTLPTTWAATVLLGALTRLHRDDLRRRLRVGVPGSPWSLLTALAVLAACAGLFDYRELPMYLGGPVLAGVAACVVVLWCEEWREVRSPIVVPFVGMGTISYAAYLWNYPVVTYLAYAELPALIEVVVGVALTLGLAGVSWVVVEKPAQRFKARSSAPVPKASR